MTATVFVSKGVDALTSYHNEACQVRPGVYSKKDIADWLCQRLQTQKWIWIARPLDRWPNKNHHGVLVMTSAGPMVREFNSFGKVKRDAEPRWISLEEFLHPTSSVRIYEHYDQEIDIWRAMKVNGGSFVRGSYNELQKNCEHFVYALLGIRDAWSQGEDCRLTMAVGREARELQNRKAECQEYPSRLYRVKID